MKKIISLCAAFAVLLGMAGPANAAIIADFGTLTVIPPDSGGDTTSFAAGAGIDNQYLFRIAGAAQVVNAAFNKPGGIFRSEKRPLGKEG